MVPNLTQPTNEEGWLDRAASPQFHRAYRVGSASDPDRVFDSASELSSEWGGLDPDLAADSALVLTADPKNTNTPIA
jgi:hypothetical protein